MPLSNAEMCKRYRRKHPENAERRRAANRRMRIKKSTITKQERDKIRKLKLKTEVLNMYGGCKCINCPETRIGALTLDHINNDGAEHRKVVLGLRLYQYLKDNNFPPGYQVLCANCNWLKYVAILNATPKSPKGEVTRTRSIKAKLVIMTKLGGACSCGITNIDLLTVHHKNNDGAAHRKEISKGRGGVHFYTAMLRINADLSNLECRCFSCNDAEPRTSSRIL